MPDFKKINAAMEATLRAEGATTPSSAKPTPDHIDEFLGRFKLASLAVEGAQYGAANNTQSWLKQCPGALALIVGRAMPLDPWRLFEFALVGAPAGGVGEVITQYRGRLVGSSGKDLSKARALAGQLVAELG